MRGGGGTSRGRLGVQERAAEETDQPQTPAETVWNRRAAPQSPLRATDLAPGPGDVGDLLGQGDGTARPGPSAGPRLQKEGWLRSRRIWLLAGPVGRAPARAAAESRGRAGGAWARGQRQGPHVVQPQSPARPTRDAGLSCPPHFRGGGATTDKRTPSASALTKSWSPESRVGSHCPLVARRTALGGGRSGTRTCIADFAAAVTRGAAACSPRRGSTEVPADETRTSSRAKTPAVPSPIPGS